MKGRPIIYGAEELAWLESNRTLPIGDYHRAFCEAFRRTDITAHHLHALRKRRGWKTGRTGQFERGQAPCNKGKKCEPGRGGLHPNSRRTQFAKGQRSGVAIKLYKPIGTERMSKDGYVERKIHDGLPMQSRWRAVHLIRWEEAHGPLPKGHALKCLDGNRTNTDPSNWDSIPRALLPRLAGGNRKQYLAYEDASDELKPTVLAIAKLDHGVRQRRRRSHRTGNLAGGTAMAADAGAAE